MGGEGQGHNWYESGWETPTGASVKGGTGCHEYEGEEEDQQNKIEHTVMKSHATTQNIQMSKK